MQQPADRLKSRVLSRRLITLFFAASVVPVVLSDWVATALTTQLADRLALEDRARGTRQVSRQILDRLIMAKAALLASGSTAESAQPPDATTQPLLAVDELPSRSPMGHAAGLASLWASGEASHAGAGLRVVAAADASRVLIGAKDAQGRVRIGEINPEFLWAPTRETDEDSEWRVTDDSGRILSHRRVNSDGGSVVTAGTAVRTVSRLFLGSAFSAPDWLIERRSPPPRAEWAGLSLQVWLVLVAMATTLAVILVARWQILRVLGPLHRLTDGTRRLAAGEAGARVHGYGDDEVGQLAQAFNDMASRVEQRERSLRHLADHDSLTELLNRYGLHQAMDAQLKGDADKPAVRAVLTIDLDRFKDVNDSQGHDVGDLLLKQVADRLRPYAAADSIVARLGGDEFVVVVPLRSEADADAHATSIVNALNVPFCVRGTEFVVGASVGVALAPRDGSARDELLRRSDAALYAAKESGRARYVMFSSAHDRAAEDRARTLGELHAAIERREFVLFFQPRVRSADGAVLSAEALIRWQHPTRGLLSPAAFIQIAEHSGVIDAIGHLVLEAACAQLAEWRRLGHTSMHVSVNVSSRQLIDGTLPAKVLSLLARYALPAEALELEITESVMVGDFESARRQLGELRRAGLRIAMDDFGTGFSSLSVLRTLPIDVMKIDRQFVSELARPDSYAIVRAIIALARELDLRLVAEGVETAEQADALRSLGCDELQGYLFGKPMPAERFLRQHLSPASHKPGGPTPVSDTTDTTR